MEILTENQKANLKRAYSVLAFEFFLILFFSLFSQPLRLLGLTGWLPIELLAAGKAGRVVLVYHAIAVPFVSSLLFIYLSVFDRKADHLAVLSVPGYVLTSAGALSFAYIYRSWIFHGLFIFGLSLVFFAGVLFLKELWLILREEKSLEALAYLITTLFILISAIIGASVASYFGDGFKAFLAEDVLRSSHDIFQRAIIAHLHIMLALIDVFLLLLIISAFKPGAGARLKRILLILIILGTLIVTMGTWSVIVLEKIAHKIINFGSTFLLLPALLLAFYGLKEKWRDAPWLGIFLYLVAINFFVTAPGVYVAIKLETFRSLPYYVERTFAVGHWHILSTITAVIAFLLLVTFCLKGKERQFVGYLATLGSALAFLAGLFYQFQGKSVLVMRLIDFGVLIILSSIGVFLWRVPRLWQKRGVSSQ